MATSKMEVEALMTQSTEKGDHFFNTWMVPINQDENPNHPKGKLAKYIDDISPKGEKYDDMKKQIKNETKIALAGVAQWIEYQPANQRVAGSIPSQGTCLGCGLGPQ